MPEFRFRRRKQPPGGGGVAGDVVRRRTLNDAENDAEQIRLASELVKQKQDETETKEQTKSKLDDKPQPEDGRTQQSHDVEQHQPESTQPKAPPTGEELTRELADTTRGIPDQQEESSSSSSDEEEEGVIADDSHDRQQAGYKATAAAVLLDGDGPDSSAKQRLIPLVSKRSSFLQEREKFFELLKSKYPEQASNFELEQVFSGDDTPPLELLANGHGDLPGTASTSELSPVSSPSNQRRSSPNRYNECLFLRYGKHIRRCPMPSPLTLSTLKNLFINMFDLSPTLFDHTPCSILIQDQANDSWRNLEKPGDVTDHCRLLLVDTPTQGGHAPSQDSDINLPFNFDVSTLDSQSSGQRSQSSLGSLSGSPNEGAGHRGKEDNQATPKSEFDPTAASNNGLWRSNFGLGGADLSLLPSTLPIHHPHSLTPVTLSQTSQPSPPPTPPHPHPHPSQTLVKSAPTAIAAIKINSESQSKVDRRKLAKKAHNLQHSAQVLKLEVKKMREDHLQKMSDFSRDFKLSSDRILSAMTAFSKTAGLRRSQISEDFRRERLELYADKEAYARTSESSLAELGLLEQAVDCLRVDVVERRCKVEEEELGVLSQAGEEASRSVGQVESQFTPLREKMKRVMEKELQVIVSEERFLEAETQRVQGSRATCEKVSQTLDTMKQYAAVQSHRTPLIPLFVPVPDPDRQALMENISAITPNHAHRVESLALAESVLQKKKALHSPVKRRLRKFENELRIQVDHLRPTTFWSDMERRREMKLKAMFLDEKFQREKKMEEELELQRKAAEKKRNEERKKLEEKWRRNESERRAQVIALRKQTHSNSFGSRSGNDQHVPVYSSGIGIRNELKQPAPVHSKAQNDNPPKVNPFEKETTPPATSTAPITGRMTMLPQQLQAEHVTFQSQKRKSIGYIGELTALDPHYDTLIPASKVKPISKSITRLSPAGDEPPPQNSGDEFSPGTRRKQEVADLQRFWKDIDRAKRAADTSKLRTRGSGGQIERRGSGGQIERRGSSSRRVEQPSYQAVAAMNGGAELMNQADSERLHTRGNSLGAKDMPQRPTKYQERQLRSISDHSLQEGSRLHNSDTTVQLRQKSPQHGSSSTANREMAIFDSETLRVQPPLSKVVKPQEGARGRGSKYSHVQFGQPQQQTVASRAAASSANQAHSRAIVTQATVIKATTNKGHGTAMSSLNDEAASRGVHSNSQPTTVRAPHPASQPVNRGGGANTQTSGTGRGGGANTQTSGTGRGGGANSQTSGAGKGGVAPAPSQPRFHHMYTHHVPTGQAGKSKSRPLQTTASGGGVKGQPKAREKRRSGYSDVSAFNSGAHSDVSDNRSSGLDSNHPTSENGVEVLKPQFQINEPLHRDPRNPNPLQTTSIPMRVTKSAQTPLNADVPITSYPRSYTHHQAQKRTASNGRIPYQQVHLPGSMSGNHGNPPRQNRGGGGVGHHHHGNQSFATRHDPTVGSLV